jgi:hypothetical protein
VAILRFQKGLSVFRFYLFGPNSPQQAVGSFISQGKRQ